jgi:arsenate reductase
MTAHWGVEDPAAFHDTEADQHQKFCHVTRMLRRRIELFLSLPLATLDRMTTQATLKEIRQK